MSEVIDHGERAHSEIGASSASRWLGCPASVSLSRGIEESSSSFAEEGTYAHELSEHCLEQNLTADEVTEFQGKPVPSEMKPFVQYYLNAMEKYTNEDSGYDTFVEQRFSMPKIHKDMFGSNDFCAFGIENKEMVIVDFKYGAGLNVLAKENIQMIIYALGAYYEFDHIYDFKTVKLVIVQPRIEGGEYDEWSISIKELLKYEKILKAGVKKVYSKKPDISSGDHCKWCKAKAVCPKLKSELEDLVQNKFDTMPVESKPVLPEVVGMSGDQIVKILKHEKLITDWFKSVASYAHSKLQKGEEVEGYKLVARKSNRKVENESEFKLQFEDTFGDALYVPRKLLGVIALEKLVGKKESEAFFVKPDTGTTIAVTSDKRKEIVIKTASDMFDDADTNVAIDYSQLEF